MVKLAMIGADGYAYELIKRVWKIPEKIDFMGASTMPTRKSLGKRKCQEKGIPVYDEVDQLLEAMQSGMADCSGVALGVDRLVMLASGVTDIQEVIAFPFERA